MNDEYWKTKLLVLEHEQHQLRIACESVELENRKKTKIISEQTKTISELTAKNEKLEKKLIDLQDKLSIN